MKRPSTSNFKRYMPYTKLGIFVLFFGYFGYFLLAAFFSTNTNAFSGNGSGTESDPYQISSCSELQEISGTAYNEHYILINDIDCSDTQNWSNKFESISSFNAGTLDGRWHTISNLYIEADATYLGLFSQLPADAVVKNLQINGGSITNTNPNSGINYTGTIAGVTLSGSSINNVSVMGLDITTNSSAGGIVGQHVGTINKGRYSGNVTSSATASAEIGGIVARLEGGTINDSIASATPYIANPSSPAAHMCGGLVGHFWSIGGGIHRSYSRGRIDCSTINGGATGGLVGYLQDDARILIADSFAAAEIAQTATYNGAFIGGYANQSQSTELRNNYYDVIRAGISECMGEPLGSEECGQVNINTSPDYFNSETNEPMTQWNFSSIWESGAEFPQLLQDPLSPESPQNVTAQTLSYNSVSLTWNAPLNNGGSAVTEYNVSYKATSDSDWYTYAQAPADTTNMTVVNLNPETTYLFRVQAVNDNGYGLYSESTQTTTSAQPAAQLDTPTNLIRSDASSTSVTIAWDSVADAQYYQLSYHGIDDINWTYLDPTNEVLQQVSGLTPSTSYVFRVQAFGDIDQTIFSDFSSEFTTTTLAAEDIGISNCSELQDINNNLAANYILDQNIDCSESQSWNNGAGFEPIGAMNEDPFTGNFNGNGFTISNLYINSTNISVALFEQTTDSLIRDVALQNPTVITSNAGGVSTLIGRAVDSTIHNISVNNMSITSTGTSLIGGVIAWHNGTLTNASVTGNIDADVSIVNQDFGGTGLVGGIIGAASGEDGALMGINRSYSDVDMNLTMSNEDLFTTFAVGGVAGASTFADITNVYSKGSINLSSPLEVVPAYGTSVGGVTGLAMGNSMISNVYSSGSLTNTVQASGSGGVGGITGGLFPTASISNSFSTSQLNALESGIKGSAIGAVLFADGEADPVYNNLWHNGTYNCLGAGINTSTGQPVEDLNTDACGEITNPNTYFNSRTIQPLNTWDFRDTWKMNANDYPSFITYSSTPLSPNSIGISNCDELQAIRENPADKYHLTNTIDCAVSETWNSGEGFAPIGEGDNPFTGTFDGRGHTIKNLYINYDQDPNLDTEVRVRGVGLFGMVNNATITDIKLIDSSITTPQSFSNKTIFLGSVVGLTSLNSKINNITVTNTATQGGSFVGGIIGGILPIYSPNPDGLVEALIPNPNNTNRMKLDNIHYEGTVDGVISGGIVGISATDVNISKNITDSYKLLLTNSSSNATVRTTTGGGLIGVSYSLGSDPASYLLYNSIANGNMLTILQIIGELDETYNPCENPAAIPELVYEQLEFYCSLVAQNKGYDISSIGTRIEHSHSSGLITSCNSITGSAIRFLGGLVGGGAGIEIRSSHSTAEVTSCPGTLGEVAAPPSSIGSLGGLAAVLLNSRIKDSYYNGTIASNANNQPGAYAGFSGGLSGIMLSLGDLDGKPIVQGSYSTGSIELDKPKISISMSGGSIGLLAGAGTITDTYSTMDINNLLTRDVSDFTQSDFGTYLGNIFQGINKPLGVTYSGGLVGSTFGIDFQAIINSSANLAEVSIEDASQPLTFSRNYDLGNVRGIAIKDSFAKSNVNGTFAGGVLGSSDSAVSVNKTYAEGEVTGTFAGGFVGASGVPGGVLAFANRGILGSDGNVCENGLGESVPVGTYIDVVTCGYSQINNLEAEQKGAIQSSTPVFKQLSIENSYTKSNVTGVPIKLDITIELDDTETYSFLPPVIRGIGLPTTVGGISGLYGPAGGSLKNSYASGNITTLPYEYSGEQNQTNVVKPINDMAGGMYGLNLGVPQITIGKDNKKAAAALTRSSFFAGEINPANKTWQGNYSGIILHPLNASDIIFGDELNRPAPQVIDKIYYDSQKLESKECTGVRNKQVIIDVARNFNPEFNEYQTEDIPDDFVTNIFGSGSCTPADTASNPNYFIDNSSNAPLNGWVFGSVWQKQQNDYPDFIGYKTDSNNPGNPTDPGATPPNGPTITRTTWPTSVPVFGFSSASDAPALDLGTLPRIGSSPFLISGLSAKAVQALPWMLLLLVALLYLQQSWQQNQVNRRFRAATKLSIRVKATLSGFLNITSHYLSTPAATIATSLELLTGTQAIRGERAKSLTTTANELKNYVNELNKTAQDHAADKEAALAVPKRLANTASMRRWVVMPIVAASLILIISLGTLDQIEVIEVTRATLLLNIALLIFSAILVYTAFKIRLNQEAANHALDRALSVEKAIVEQRKDLILEAESRLNVFAKSLELSNKTLEKSKNAKPYMNGLADLQKVADSFHKVYKFATTSMPYSSEVSPAILEALAPIRLEAKTRHIELTTDIPPDINTLFSLDEAHHVIYSLMDNALKFSAEGSKVKLTVRDDSHQTFIQVVDHGIGIAEDKLETVMQPFARATDTKKYDYEGMGLDLFITRILVEKYGGSIDMKSTIDEGTTVTIILDK